MKTYFARHSGNLDIEEETIALLRQSSLIAIHYPWDKYNQDGGPDSRSLNPDDYDGKAKGAIRALLEASSDGGFVFATYRGQKKALIGRVEPGTPIELVHAHWKSEQNRPAVLKTLKLVDCLELPIAHQARLAALAPQQSTFTRWPGVGDQVKHAAMRASSPPSLELLTSTQQEVMCSEYLRGHNQDLPILQALLMPVGRTMKDFDIVGIATDGRPLVAQITYGTDAKKLERFLSQDDGTSHMIYFCREKEARIVGNVRIVPLSLAYTTFTSSLIGKAWLSAVHKFE